MSDWQRIDSDAINQPRMENLDGVKITVYLSRDDIPTFVKGELREGGKILAIRFRYETAADTGIVRESLLERRHNKHTRLLIGKKSGRIYEVRFDLTEPTSSVANALKPIEDVLEQLSGREPSSNDRIDNYRAVRGALNQVREDLSCELTCH